ncbi:Ferritin-1, chloroplastic [Galdieria sulphuraria]|nr:Ferritin-1, chloroplastic [Galdieria sulphuraria]
MKNPLLVYQDSWNMAAFMNTLYQINSRCHFVHNSQCVIDKKTTNSLKVFQSSRKNKNILVVLKKRDNGPQCSQENKSTSGKERLEFAPVDLSKESPSKELVFRRDELEERETRVNVGYDCRCEEALNNHICVEYTASYVYHGLFAFFDRDTVALPGFAKYFNEQSIEERQHAHEFIQYQNARGGRVVLKPIALPEMGFESVDATSDVLYAMDLHLQLEKYVYRKLLQLHKVATEAEDVQLQDFVEKYLEHQVGAIKVAAEYVAQIKRVGTGHGVYDIDRKLL